MKNILSCSSMHKNLSDWEQKFLRFKHDELREPLKCDETNPDSSLDTTHILFHTHVEHYTLTCQISTEHDYL